MATAEGSSCSVMMGIRCRGMGVLVGVLWRRGGVAVGAVRRRRMFVLELGR